MTASYIFAFFGILYEKFIIFHRKNIEFQGKRWYVTTGK